MVSSNNVVWIGVHAQLEDSALVYAVTEEPRAVSKDSEAYAPGMLRWRRMIG
mgnify:CR=1 FL=1